MKRIDLSLPLGIFLTIVIILLSISGGKGGVLLFFDLRSIGMVFFSTLLLTISSFSFKDFRDVCVIAFHSAFYRSDSFDDVITKVVGVVENIRKNGVLSEQNKLKNIADFSVFVAGIQMYIDGFNKEDVLHSSEQVASFMNERFNTSIGLVEKSAELSPGMGLVGTLIGLVKLLVNIKDANSIAPSMGFALITTLYGSFFSFVIFSPLASRIAYIQNESILLNKIFLQSLVYIGEEKSHIQLKVVLQGIVGSHFQEDKS